MRRPPLACEFYVYANYKSCNQICASKGGSCEDAWDDTAGNHCLRDGWLGCSYDQKLGLLCRCTRG